MPQDPLMTQEQEEFERNLGREEAEREMEDEYEETLFEEQYENAQFAQDGDFENTPGDEML